MQTLLAEATASGPGTSKTLQGPAPIIYTSRTHSQLAQVIRELKRTSYRCQDHARCCLLMFAAVS